jgi:hypothetical protein
MKHENRIFIFGLSILVFILLLPPSNSAWMDSLYEKGLSPDCKLANSALAAFCPLGQWLTLSSWSYLTTLETTSSTLKWAGAPSDITQDIIGFRALVAKGDPYPRLGTALGELGLEWRIEHASTHPPTTFLFAAPVAFLPWNWGLAVWAWLMVFLLALTLRQFDLSWKTAIGYTFIALLWPPIATSLGQMTIIWLFALTAASRADKKSLWGGIYIGLAALTKLLPALMTISFLLKKQWRAFAGFLLTLAAALAILLFLHPGSIVRYLEVNRTNSAEMMFRADNAALLVMGYRFGGWVGVALLLGFFASILYLHRKNFFGPGLEPSSKSWVVLSYFSVALLPVSWIYSVTPLLPIMVMLISRKKLSTMIIGSCCMIIPLFIPPFGPSAAIPMALVNLLVGIGLLIDELPYRLFTATYLKDLFQRKEPAETS